jgi:uncharacterized protein with ParB-like and HNH nuclease domain
MNQTDTNTTENPNFRLKAIAEFLDGKHNFTIPSYQRGYRWDKKQIEDLLKDISDFAHNDENKKEDFYCLQPIVVKKDESNNSWIVIDGQQRLTTLHLLLEYLKVAFKVSYVINKEPYSIKYETRAELDLNKPEKINNIDSFHIFNAKKVINEWFDKRVDIIDLSAFTKVLFFKGDGPKVKAIWYVDQNENNQDSIKSFNNLNKGKIGLTNAELIKALFILKAKKEKSLNLDELIYEWNEIENTLHDNRFWYFLANKDYNPPTRIDIIFDFLTKKGSKDDSDFSYRRFQDLFDSEKIDFWNEKGIKDFTKAWKEVKSIFHTFKYWYEESTLYHYIGYLIFDETSINDIYKECKDSTRPEIEKKLQEMIRKKFSRNDNNPIIIGELTYENDKTECKKILLLFNIQTCVDQQRNLNETVKNNELLSYYKFPFDLFKLNNWDVEHVGSKTENPLTKKEDKKIWLSYIKNIHNDYVDWENIVSKANYLFDQLENNIDVKNNEFKEVYDSICMVIQKTNNLEKDTISNLTLLDAGTNRGYGNALFPTKREKIIENDKNGIFIPPCTKNLFLKYYSTSETGNNQWENSWNEADSNDYLKSIESTIGILIK